MQILLRAYIAIAALLFGLVILGTIVALIPYDPQTIYDIHTLPDAVCPGEITNVYADYDLEDFSSIESIHISNSWIADNVTNLPTGAEVPESPIDLSYDQLAPGHTQEISKVSRIAPMAPGIWTLRVRYSVIRYPLLGIIPKSDNETKDSSKTLTVKEC